MCRFQCGWSVGRECCRCSKWFSKLESWESLQWTKRKAFKDDLNIQVLVEDLFASSSGKNFICQAGSENTWKHTNAFIPFPRPWVSLFNFCNHQWFTVVVHLSLQHPYTPPLLCFLSKKNLCFSVHVFRKPTAAPSQLSSVLQGGPVLAPPFAAYVPASTGPGDCGNLK